MAPPGRLAPWQHARRCKLCGPASSKPAGGQLAPLSFSLGRRSRQATVPTVQRKKRCRSASSVEVASSSFSRRPALHASTAAAVSAIRLEVALAEPACDRQHGTAHDDVRQMDDTFIARQPIDLRQRMVGRIGKRLRVAVTARKETPTAAVGWWGRWQSRSIGFLKSVAPFPARRKFPPSGGVAPALTSLVWRMRGQFKVVVLSTILAT